jgi:hypothetical protein
LLDRVLVDHGPALHVPIRLRNGPGPDIRRAVFLALGLDDGGISGEAADLNNDGLLDLVFASDPDNSGLALSMADYESRVYWNTGTHGARDNHWLRLRFSGVTDAELIGARPEAREPGSGKLLAARWFHCNHSYKSSGALEAHFGLGKQQTLDIAVIFPSGKTLEFRNLKADRFLDLDLKEEKSTLVGNPE